MCAIFITTFPIFLLIRLVQGLTAGGIIVIAKAFAGDYYQGNTLAKFLASLMVVNGIVTILMPLLGGLSLSLGSWRIIFVILTAISMIMLGGVTFNMPTTHHSEHVTFLNIYFLTLDVYLNDQIYYSMFLQGLTYVMLFSFHLLLRLSLRKYTI